jgi:hypothetical protein
VAVRGARVGRPLGLSLPGTRGVARASGSALPLRESSLLARKENESETARLPMRCRKKVGDEAFSGRLERNDTGRLNARSLRDASHRTRARRTACGSSNIDPPFPSSSRCRPPTKQASLAPRSRRVPRTWSARPSTPRSRPTTTRRVRLPRLARVPTNGNADARLSRAPTGTGRTGMFAIPPNNYDFYTEEEKYVRGLPREDEAVASTSWLRNDTRNDARRFSSTRMFLFSFFSFALEDARRPTFRPPLRGPCPT